MARQKKNATKKQNFAHYAVHKGRWPNKIHDDWATCEANVKEFSGARYKGFNHRIAAVDWLRDMRTKDAFKKMMQENKKKAVQSACVDTSTPPDAVSHAIPVATATLIPPTVPPTAIPTAKAVPVRGTSPNAERDFSTVAELIRLIAASPVDGLPPLPKYSNKLCSHLCDEATHIQQILL